jgi:LuxR family maltose regulon positive regulatory protein
MSNFCRDPSLPADFEIRCGGSEKVLVEQLNWQESRILQLIAQGMQNGEIAKQLSLTEGTVKWYIQRIFDKLGVRRRALAVKRAYRLGIITRNDAF